MDISTAEGFNSIRSNLEGSYVVTGKIDLSKFTNWDPIGTENNPFVGSIDGQGNLISGLKINDSTKNYAGLFGYCKGATIKNLNVCGDVKANNYVGGIVGYYILSNSTGGEYYGISDCHFDGNVTGVSTVGGIVGYMRESGIRQCSNRGFVTATGSIAYAGGIAGEVVLPASSGSRVFVRECFNVGDIKSSDCGGIVGFSQMQKVQSGIVDCYHYGTLTGKNNVGGICGMAPNTEAKVAVKNCYSAGNINLNSTSLPYYASGIVAFLAVGAIVSSFVAFPQISGSVDYDLIFCDNEEYVQPSNCFALNSTLLKLDTTYKKSNQAIGRHFKDIANDYEFIFDVLGWDKNVWRLTYGEYPFPHLINLSTLPGFEQPTEYTYTVAIDGKGTSESPYVITNYEQLELIRDMPDKYYIQKADISFVRERPSNSKVQWKPIGDSEKPFVGRYNGNGFTITMGIDQSDCDEVGLFGVIGEKGTVMNVQVFGSVKGRNNVGAIAGYNRGTVKNCFVDVSVSGCENVGGIVGSNQAGSVVNGFSSDNTCVTGSCRVGGLVGENAGSIMCCYSRGIVQGFDSVGGITGINYSNGTFSSVASKSVAINDKLESQNADHTGRIAGENFAKCEINYASEKLTISAENDKHGKTKTLEELKSTAFWSDTGFWGSYIGKTTDKPWCLTSSFPVLYFMLLQDIEEELIDGQ